MIFNFLARPIFAIVDPLKGQIHVQDLYRKIGQDMAPARALNVISNSTYYTIM